MNTNTIKSFARQARTLLLEGVRQRLSYWGFQTDGTNNLTLEMTAGGYIFRGQVFTDTAVPATWNKLKKRLTNKQAVQDVVEEAAYVWFNRLMAIKILEENGYLSPQLHYAPGVRTPLLVQNAKKGQHGIIRRPYIDLLNEYLREDKEEDAFGLLLTQLCNNHALLHDVFDRIDDYTEILLPQNLLQAGGLIDLVNGQAIPADDYREVELIGWLYQFYISDKKDDVFAGFKKGKKARAEDIPAATQIFTPKWIVKYMVENTVGKLYLEYEPASELKADMKYLVENEGDCSQPSLIIDLSELTLLDPAAGSGHILVTAFELLFRMYREAGYTARNAVESILKYNLFGLDIDDRAMQLARFAVLLKAASYDAAILGKGIMPYIYSFPETVAFSIADIKAFLGTEGQPYHTELTEVLAILGQGKNIGSALKVKLSAEARRFIAQQYEQWKQKQRMANLNIQETSLWHSLCPYLDVLLVLSMQYTAVVANPPYMGIQNMNSELKKYVEKNYPDSKTDLMTVFMESSINFLRESGRFGMINIPTWMSNGSFNELREKIIKHNLIESLIHNGRGVFGADFGSVSFCIKKMVDNGKKGTYRRLFTEHVKVETNNEKENRFLDKNFGSFTINQRNFLILPNQPIAYWLTNKFIELFRIPDSISTYGYPKQGLATADNNRFLRYWNEVDFNKIKYYNKDFQKNEKFKWFPYNKGGDFRRWFGNTDFIVNWENDGEEIKNFKDEKGKPRSRPQNLSFYFKTGLTWSDIGSGKFSIRLSDFGAIFDSTGPTLFLKSEEDLEFFLALLNTKITQEILNVITPNIHYSNGVVRGFPVLFANNEVLNEVNVIAKSAVKISKQDWRGRETSWDFAQSPLLNEAPSLKQAYQRWGDTATRDFYQLHAIEEELNRIFIDIYGLQEELTPEVALKDITILQQELDRSALEELVGEEGDIPQLPIKNNEVLSQFVSYAIGVLLGRYRLDAPGLHIAHPNPTEEEIAGYIYKSHAITIDEDAILPLIGEDGAFPDDALLRIKDLILTVWGEASLTENLNFLHNGLGMNLNKWLTEKFWGYHVSMYKKKPIYWLFCSNTKKPHQAAFRVLVYMHRMDKYSVGKIQRKYLHQHQEHIRHEIQRLTEQENNLGRNEQRRLETLRRHELECRDYNEVLKGLSLREIDFDLDDGVDVNYAKFEGAVAEI